MAAHHAACAKHAAAAVGVKPIVLGHDRDVTAGHVDDQRFNTFIAVADQDRPVLNEYGGIRVDPVISGRDIDLSSCHCDITCGMDPVSCSGNVQ